jgi:hypothetical protein
MVSPAFADLDDFVIALYSSLDDALQTAGIVSRNGKLTRRPGPTPDVDDREVLCIAVLQEILGFESDHSFYSWFENQPDMKRLFPRRLSRQNFADRRALLTDISQQLCRAFCELDGEGTPPFSLLTPIPSMSAVPSVKDEKNGSAA